MYETTQPLASASQKLGPSLYPFDGLRILWCSLSIDLFVSLLPDPLTKHLCRGSPTQLHTANGIPLCQPAFADRRSDFDPIGSPQAVIFIFFRILSLLSEFYDIM